jgi:hypothetical protein
MLRTKGLELTAVAAQVIRAVDNADARVAAHGSDQRTAALPLAVRPAATVRLASACWIALEQLLHRLEIAGLAADSRRNGLAPLFIHGVTLSPVSGIR